MIRRPGAFAGALTCTIALLATACATDTNPSEHSDGPATDDQPGRAVSAEPVWSTEKLTFASRPAQVGDHLVAYLAVDGQLALAGFDPASGTEVWRRDSTASSITPGVSLDVASKGSTVYHLKPVDPGSRDAAYVEARDANSGEQLWQSDLATTFEDQLNFCKREGQPAGTEARKRKLCITVSDEDVRWVFDAESGQRTQRRFDEIGRDIGQGLHDAGDEIVYVPDGTEAWRSTPSEMFAGRNVDPDHGWNWQRRDGLLVGTFGRVPSEDESAEHPAGSTWTEQFRPKDDLVSGVDAKTGENVWLEHGNLWCGALSDLKLAEGIRCRVTGSVTYRRTDSGRRKVQDTDLDVRIEAFSPTDGSARWAVALDGFGAYWDEDRPLVRLDRRTFATVLDDGRSVAVDLNTGEKRAIDEDVVGWCARYNRYPYDRSYSSFRRGHSFVSPCRPNGKAVKAPESFPEDFGARIGDIYAWADADGMHAVRTK